MEEIEKEQVTIGEKKNLALSEVSIRHDCVKSIICVNSGNISKMHNTFLLRWSDEPSI